MSARPVTWMLLAVALLALGYEFVVAPVAQALVQANDRAAQAKEDFLWVQANVASASAGRPASSGVARPVQALEDALVRTGIRAAAERIERQDNNVVVTLREAGFAQTVQWLALVEQELRLPVASMRLTPAERPGTVSGVVVVVSGAGP